MINVVLFNGGHKVARRISTRAEYLAVRNTAQNSQNFVKARKGDDNAKRSLVQFNYNDQLPDGMLAGCHCATSTFSHDIDCGKEEECKQIAEKLLSMKADIGLLELSVSPNWGLHAICRRELGKTILENQVRLSQLTQTEMDTNAHDAQRIMFTGPADEATLLYLDDSIFEEPLTEEQGYAEFARIKEREQKGQEEVPAGAKKSNKHYRPWEDSVVAPQPKAEVAAAEVVPEVATPVAADEGRIMLLTNSILEQKGLEPRSFVEEGGRHIAAKIFLAAANSLFDKRAAQSALRTLMGSYAESEDIKRLLNDYYSKYYDSSKPLYKWQEELFTQNRNYDSASEDMTVPPVYGDTALLHEIYSNPQPPMLPRRLPNFVFAVTCKTPRELKATVAQGMFPPLGAYPKELSFRYTDNQYRELRMNCLTIGETGTGKDTCMNQPLKYLTAPMEERDNISRQKEENWKSQCKTKGQTQDKPQRPTDIVIQKLTSDVTSARLAQAMKDGEGKTFCYTRLNEFDQWYGIEGQKSSATCTFTNLKIADDEQAVWGQDRVSSDSVTYIGPLNLNWNASVTPSRVQKMFANVMVDGPVSRLCLATTPYVGVGAELPVYGVYDERYGEKLKPYIDNLMKATGKVVCKEAIAMVKRFQEEINTFSILTQNRVFDNLSHRALVAAFRKACLLYAANGMKWEKSIEGFCRWSLHYDLWIKMKYFSAGIQKADSGVATIQHGPKNLLEELPEEFTREDVIKVRAEHGLAGKPTNVISQWKSRKLIQPLENGRYKNLKVLCMMISRGFSPTTDS